MTGKKERDGLRELHDQTLKALRRGEKFAKSLTRIMAQSDPDAPAQALLKSVEDGVAMLRKQASELERLGWPSKVQEKAKGKLKSAKAVSDDRPSASGKKAAEPESKRADLPLPQFA